MSKTEFKGGNNFPSPIRIDGIPALSHASFGDYFYIGDATHVSGFPQLTAAQWAALTKTSGMMCYDGDADLYRCIGDVTTECLFDIADETETAFNDGSATPSVQGKQCFVTANTGATTITDFQDGIEGKRIEIRFGDANTTIQHGVTIFLSGGANKTFAVGETLVLRCRTGAWYQIGGEI